MRTSNHEGLEEERERTVRSTARVVRFGRLPIRVERAGWREGWGRGVTGSRARSGPSRGWSRRCR
jgi:hypothetical protein